MNKNTFKLFYGISIAILFIILGFYLINKGDRFSIWTGYANIIFWSGLLLFTIYKLITKKT